MSINPLSFLMALDTILTLDIHSWGLHHFCRIVVSNLKSIEVVINQSILDSLEQTYFSSGRNNCCVKLCFFVLSVKSVKAEHVREVIDFNLTQNRKTQIRENLEILTIHSQVSGRYAHCQQLSNLLINLRKQNKTVA